MNRQESISGHTGTIGDRLVKLGPESAAIPERLLQAHALGKVLFIVGAGVPMGAGLPDFRGLVLKVYAHLDPPVHQILTGLPTTACKHCYVDFGDLNHGQRAEVRRFISQDYDVVLGMLERRLDGQSHRHSSVRQVIADKRRAPTPKPSPVHRALMRLADRGGAAAIVTTNFDLLLEDAARNIRFKAQTYALGGIPKPGHGSDFSGVFHIHGALDRKPESI